MFLSKILAHVQRDGLKWYDRIVISSSECTKTRKRHVSRRDRIVCSTTHDAGQCWETAVRRDKGAYRFANALCNTASFATSLCPHPTIYICIYIYFKRRNQKLSICDYVIRANVIHHHITFRNNKRKEEQNSTIIKWWKITRLLIRTVARDLVI